MTYDKEKFERIQVLLPKEYAPKLDVVRGRFKRSPFISDLVVKHIQEEEKKNPDKFK
jgi:metal-responsive CopG/Arc/MetJ family transcriptional regulator